MSKLLNNRINPSSSFFLITKRQKVKPAWVFNFVMIIIGHSTFVSWQSTISLYFHMRITKTCRIRIPKRKGHSGRPIIETWDKQISLLCSITSLTLIKDMEQILMMTSDELWESVEYFIESSSHQLGIGKPNLRSNFSENQVVLGLIYGVMSIIYTEILAWDRTDPWIQSAHQSQEEQEF